MVRRLHQSVPDARDATGIGVAGLLGDDGTEAELVVSRYAEPRHPASGKAPAVGPRRAVAPGEVEPATAGSLRLQAHLAVGAVGPSQVDEVPRPVAAMKPASRLDPQRELWPHVEPNGASDDALGTPPVGEVDDPRRADWQPLPYAALGSGSADRDRSLLGAVQSRTLRHAHRRPADDASVAQHPPCDRRPPSVGDLPGR